MQGTTVPETAINEDNYSVLAEDEVWTQNDAMVCSGAGNVLGSKGRLHLDVAPPPCDASHAEKFDHGYLGRNVAAASYRRHDL